MCRPFLAASILRVILEGHCKWKFVLDESMTIGRLRLKVDRWNSGTKKYFGIFATNLIFRKPHDSNDYLPG